MRRNNLFLLIFMFIFSSFFVLSCAGTKKDENKPAAQEEKQQKDLDDIESLLGITSDQPASKSPAKQKKQTVRKKKSDEKLNLLETSDMNAGQKKNSMASAAVAQQKKNGSGKYKKEVQTLKKQINQKDKQISNLEEQVAEQNSQIQQLSTEPKSRSFSAPAGVVSKEEYKDKYDEARAAFESRNYRTAIDYFEALLASSSTNSLADNAQYWIGESHYQLRQYDAAIIDFEKVLTFPRSNKRAYAQFKLGLCYMRKGDTIKATEEFNRLKSDYPKSKLNARAEKFMAKF